MSFESFDRCPLNAGQHEIGSVPDICQRLCHERITVATTQASQYDLYNPDDEPCCDTTGAGMENSHEAIFRPDSGEDRQFITVDQCEGCGEEIGESTYFFQCPY